ncbi:MAG: GNAT family N-acetyltransferase [Bacteroidetes bacterium]|nr:GNAT family N-acetyltransferase [Bacteroidota bacterium]
MKRLDKDDYYKLAEQLKQVTINHFFARSVIENKASGAVFVDDTANPKTFYITHAYGMTLLAGNSDNEAFNQAFKKHALNLEHTRNTFEWMQAFPENWNAVLANLFKDSLTLSASNTTGKETGIIELNTRVNFTFDKARYLALRSPKNAPEISMVRADRQIFRDMKGSVIPAYFWKNEDDFLEQGVGFSLLYNGNLASTAYSAFIHGNQLEIGIETVEAYRGKGFAEQTCIALIDYCLANNYEPIWACRLENTGSYKLAQKLGFTPSKEIPYYRLSK